MTISLAVAFEISICGLKVVPPGIVTLVVAVGTVLQDQFAGSDHKEFAVPSQTPEAVTVTGTVMGEPAQLFSVGVTV